MRTSGRSRSRRDVRAGTSLALALAWLVATVGAVVAAGPPFPPPQPDLQVYDTGDVLMTATENHADQIVDSIASFTDVQVVVYTQRLDTDQVTDEQAQADAQALLDEWDVGGGDGPGMVVLADTDRDGGGAMLGLATNAAMEPYVDAIELDAMRAEAAPYLLGGDLDDAVIVVLAEVIREAFDPTGPASPGNGAATNAPPPGPPFPDPVNQQAVYDFAGVFSPETIASAEATIDAIEERTGAEIVVYTQQVDYGVTTSETEARARALIDQWGVGRAGFDDGLAIFFDLDPSLEHGQVQLYAAPGFEATYLSNSQRQSIFDNDMLPFLQRADLDGALLVALEQVDEAATPEHAQALQFGRQVNAVLGLVGAPIVFLGLSGWAFFSWRRYGKDPVYLDDPSILMPAPPPDLTAASGAFVMDGSSSRRALTTAMLDLASRGLLSFREDRGMLGLSNKVGVETTPPAGDAVEEAQRARNARRPIGPAEQYALKELRELGDGDKAGFIEADELPKFGPSVSTFDSKLETHVVNKGWFVEKPSKVTGRWVGRGVIAIVLGVVAAVAGLAIPISGLTLIGGAAIAGGIVICLFAAGMPAVTMPGAMIRAMLLAYQRTLRKTMEQARSMQQVVDQSGLDWLETPDQAVVWGTALGLQHQIEEVLQRSLEDVQQGRAVASATYFPTWYGSSSGATFARGMTGSGGSVFSDSGIPNLGGMMSALGTIGNSPASSGGGSGGGGFSGGSSGGGGGGAGGGF